MLKCIVLTTLILSCYYIYQYRVFACRFLGASDNWYVCCCVADVDIWLEGFDIVESHVLCDDSTDTTVSLSGQVGYDGGDVSSVQAELYWSLDEHYDEIDINSGITSNIY